MAENSGIIKERFVQKILEPVLAAQDEWGVLPSIAIAQACLESDYGRRLAAPNNFLGLKDLRFDRGSYRSRTVEDPLRSGPAVEADFEDFRNATHCLLAYGRLLARSPTYQRYRDALPDPAACARALQDIRYATDARYAEKLMQIVDGCDLRKYDGWDPRPPVAWTRSAA